MNGLCTDGTSFRCDRCELTEKGVKPYSGDAEKAPDRYESDTDDHRIGFVPDAMLRYILPEGVRPAVTPAAHGPPQSTGQSSQPPTGRTAAQGPPQTDARSYSSRTPSRQRRGGRGTPRQPQP